MPISPITPYKLSLVQQIEVLVDQILAITKDEDYFENPVKQEKVKEYECRIDQMVYKLYDLTESDIKIVKGS
ncbi:hypothetical protein [Thermosipho sp. (in: thermotogales)]|jgi:hypothetical protein|uniref:hypothetical protein n=1 Tax=Thermosipho sp. (in: thermotogales) TaxID=1968895 RepID=UPI00257ECDBF|nr:hypothetical protein [Thermosipho sp. (in: thermotogales)]MBZ4651122.1 hypothetical protein [Thermosipho sp. (in: thermotogales)]